MSLYGGRWYVMPQQVDLVKFELIFEILHNPVVLMLVIMAWLFYLCLLAWARIRDKRDLANVSLNYLDVKVARVLY